MTNVLAIICQYSEQITKRQIPVRCFLARCAASYQHLAFCGHFLKDFSLIPCLKMEFHYCQLCRFFTQHVAVLFLAPGETKTCCCSWLNIEKSPCKEACQIGWKIHRGIFTWITWIIIEKYFDEIILIYYLVLPIKSNAWWKIFLTLLQLLKSRI